MANIIAAAVIILMVGAACRYIYKEKKNGRKCIGCPKCNEGFCNCNERH